MIVALVLAVVVAVAAVVALVLSQRALAATRAQLALTEGRADHAEGATRAAEQRVEALAATQQAMTSTTEQQRQALARCEQQRAQVEGELERCAEDRIEAQAELQAARGSTEQAEADAAAQAARAEELAAALGAAEQLAAERAGALHQAQEERQVLEHQLAEARSSSAPPVQAVARAAGSPSAVGSDVAEPSWRLLLARVERQWASAVGAGGDERGVAAGPPDEQLQQAVARDLERLREEVGLHTEVTRTGAMEAVHPLLVLLAAGELAALAASQSERVAVELGSRLVVAADGWTGDASAGEALRATVAETGLAGRVEVGPDAVRVVVGAPGGAEAQV